MSSTGTPPLGFSPDSTPTLLLFALSHPLPWPAHIPDPTPGTDLLGAWQTPNTLTWLKGLKTHFTSRRD